MIIVQEKEKFDEMAILAVSSRKDGLPFRITIKSPDHSPPHAHIMDLKTGKTELGQFLLSRDAPRSLKDIKDYKQGVTDETRELVFKWASLSSQSVPEISNWKALYFTWQMNEKF